MTITESCDWIAPVTGWYKFKIKGAGGGGGGSNYNTGFSFSGGGGGEGGTTIAYEFLKKGELVDISIGIGGSGGAASQKGFKGGDSSIIINYTTYSAGGGDGGNYCYHGGQGGFGTIPGDPGSSGENNYGVAMGGIGGGNSAESIPNWYDGRNGIYGVADREQVHIVIILGVAKVEMVETVFVGSNIMIRRKHRYKAGRAGECLPFLYFFFGS